MQQLCETIKFQSGSKNVVVAIDLYHAMVILVENNFVQQASHRVAPEQVLTGKNKGFILLGPVVRRVDSAKFIG
jgi:hypothetical protein